MTSEQKETKLQINDNMTLDIHNNFLKKIELRINPLKSNLKI